MQTVISIDADVQAVALFMQENLPAGKLVAVAEHLAGLARVLWGAYPSEPCRAMSLAPSKPEALNLSQPDASESLLG